MDKRNGKRTHYSDAKRSIPYECRDCLEPVHLRGGKNACFSHNPILNRTPLQKSCPEYHDSGKIYNKLDILYINNGGIPLYLCNSGKNFKLRAYFSTISENSFKKLKQAKAKIYVNTTAFQEEDRRVYNVENLSFYPVNTIEKWIDVKCEPSIFDADVKRKWLHGIKGADIERKWLHGIRGVDIKSDIYHSNKDGGYRVALKSNISVGKTYRIMFDKYPPKIKDINFKKVGKISLKEGYVNKVIDIYEMKIEKFTYQAIEFIERKGYKLVDKANELLPLWPPAVFQGNEITFNENKAFFLHINNSTKERLYYTLKNRFFQLDKGKSKTSIILFPTGGNKPIVASDVGREKFNPEIKFIIICNSTLVRKDLADQKIIIKAMDGTEIDFDKENLKPPENGRLYIKSSIPFCATVSYKNYVISSSNKYLENVDYFRNLTIDSKAFGTRSYMYERESIQAIKSDDYLDLNLNLNWELEYSRLYRCTSPTVKISNKHIRLLHLLSQNINEENVQLYRLIETWIKTNAVPTSAIRYIDDIFELLGRVANE